MSPELREIQRRWWGAEDRIVRLAYLLQRCQSEAWRAHQQHADAIRRTGRDTPAADPEWLILSQEIDNALDEELPPSAARELREDEAREEETPT